MTGHTRMTHSVAGDTNTPAMAGSALLQFAADGTNWTTVTHGATDAKAYFGAPAKATAGAPRGRSRNRR
ncbi:hypothetical protein Airi02_102990 [Actinoallomurus iriomotensis]|uniref:Uncharacterized protein n=1 Tax=Actinoallomurus iriomotensis TaxID=478107 RepID=A0A9W6SF12_9ACTN|nr:hypothetical protein Airi02_102990 [Actinoallomurus iriomotensis]